MKKIFFVTYSKEIFQRKPHYLVVFILYSYISSGEYFLQKMQVFPYYRLYFALIDKAHDNRKKKRYKEGRHKVISDKPEEENFADRIPMMTMIRR